MLFRSHPDVYFSQKEYDELSALKCLISYNKYGGYCVPVSSSHREAAKRIILHDVYEPETIEFMVSNCHGGDIVHAGTYFGDFLPALSHGVALHSKIWAFEPNPENYRCTKITLEINGVENVVLKEAGLGAKEESLFIKTISEDGLPLGGASKIVTDSPPDLAGVEVAKITTIDTTIDTDRDISIIQLDVEGHEKEALAGALKTIQRCLPIIIIEILPNSVLLNSNWFAENILSLGYRKIRKIHGNSVFSCK